MNYDLDFALDFDLGVEKHRKSSQKLLKKIDVLLDETEENPKFGIGKPEELKGYRERSVSSLRIDQKHRLTYEIFEDQKIVKILACYGHYDD